MRKKQKGGEPAHTLNNGIDRARLLAVTTVYTLCHVDIVSGCPPGAVHSLFGFNGDSLGRADGLAKLAGNTTLFTCWVAAESMLATETWRDRALFEGVVDCVSTLSQEN